ncbi:LacI family transcriptional regulator [Actinocatenispora thailandica]|uniref:LacI family transcriptional regulator n=1 Tax=Actinocatenispora thailandica TaxID=227318 RepID=A0A7R7DW47_9ACTN|nr:LacI family DNA-binding transcriptional regulator [Actinocatenispora thailandica]BCJ38462.1 LacI family transcriptional regulator [Actinocatenispora thailandica]
MSVHRPTGTMRRRVRLSDIAEAVGCSVNTVSRALTGKDSVSPVTRAQVMAEAERLGYVPNNQARSLVLGSTRTVGLVITNPSNTLYAGLISSVELRCRALGYTVMLLATEESPESERVAAESLLHAGVDSALAVPVQAEAGHWERLRRAGVDLVFVSRELPGMDVDFVGIDNEHGAYQATAHVLDAGARVVWAVEEDLPISTVRQRRDGYLRAIADHAADPGSARVLSVPTRRRDSLTLPWQAEEAYRLAGRLVADGDLPDAFVAGNDYFALALIRALTEHGLRVPDDVLVVGYGDHPYAGYLTPTLSSVALPATELGSTAVDVLMRRTAEPEAPTTRHLIAPHLIPRESTRR